MVQERTGEELETEGIGENFKNSVVRQAEN